MIRTKSTPSNAMIMLGRMALLALMSLGLSGCIIIPTPLHGGVGVIPKETIESFEPGKTTRADILLKLGDPVERVEEDRFFTYTWDRTRAYISIYYGGSGSLHIFHHLCLEFTPDNRLKRLKVIEPFWSLSESAPCLEEWMAEERQSPPQ